VSDEFDKATMKTYDGIDYAQRPASYWADEDLPACLLRDVEGTERRNLIAAAWHGSLDEIPDNILASLKAKRPVWSCCLPQVMAKAAQVIALAP
jgi:hypothetical protein